MSHLTAGCPWRMSSISVGETWLFLNLTISLMRSTKWTKPRPSSLTYPRSPERPKPSGSKKSSVSCVGLGQVWVPLECQYHRHRDHLRPVEVSLHGPWRLDEDLADLARTADGAGVRVHDLEKIVGKLLSNPRVQKKASSSMYALILTRGLRTPRLVPTPPEMRPSSVDPYKFSTAWVRAGQPAVLETSSLCKVTLIPLNFCLMFASQAWGTEAPTGARNSTSSRSSVKAE